MSLVQRFAQVFGAVYLLVGLTGFVPPLLLGSLLATGIASMVLFGLRTSSRDVATLDGPLPLNGAGDVPHLPTPLAAYSTARLPEDGQAAADPRA